MEKLVLQDPERAAHIVELRNKRWTWPMIGREFNVSPQRAAQIYERALAEAPNLKIDEQRAEEGELIDTAVRELLIIAMDTEASHRSRIEAWNTMRGWAERRAKLFGLDAPTRHEVVTLDELDRELRSLDAQLGALAPRETGDGAGEAAGAATATR